MNVAEYKEFDGLGLADLVASGEVNATELLDAALKAIDRDNPAINAAISNLELLARKPVEQGLPDGPLREVPFFMKDDEFLVEGTTSTPSCRLLERWTANHDSTLTGRFRQAGLNIVGMTDVPELAQQPTTEPLLRGPTRNPWDTNRSAGGSSGGAAAAATAGLVPIAHATDGEGSTRIPASCCGLVGLKPSRGRNPSGPDRFTLAGGTICPHVLTRTVRDTAMVLDAVCGPDTGDPTICPPPVGAFRDWVGLPPEPLRIAVAAEPPEGLSLDRDVETSFSEGCHLLESLGHHAEPTHPNLDTRRLMNVFFDVCSADRWLFLHRVAAVLGHTIRASGFEPTTWDFLQRGASVSGEAYIDAIDVFNAPSRTMGTFHEEWDLILSPTMASIPPPLGRMSSGDPMAVARRQMTAFAPIANITGQPSISLPLGRTEDNLAVGMMFTAAIGREDTLLRIAGQLEAAAPLPRLAPPKADRKTEWPEVCMSSSRNENFLALVPQTLDGGRADRNHPVPARNLPQRGMGRLSNCGLVIGRSLDVNVVVYNESEGHCANLFD